MSAVDPDWLTQDFLRSVLQYDADSGEFRWLRNIGGGRCNELAGKFITGYRVVRLRRKQIQAHRLAWFWVHGHWPTGEIDHIDGVRSNNRISNLRDVTHAENMQNQPVGRSHASSGFRGVHWQGGRWAARIKTGGVLRTIGRFDNPEEAHAAYLREKAVIHPAWSGR